MTTQNPAGEKNEKKNAKKDDEKLKASAPTGDAAAFAEFDIPEIPIDQFSEGMTQLNTRVDGFYRPEQELKNKDGSYKKVLVPFKGIPLQVRERPLTDDERAEGKKPQKYLIVRLTLPTIAVNEEKTPIRLDPGQHLWVDLRYDYKDAEQRLPHESSGLLRVAEIAYIPEKKIALKKGGRTMWVGKFLAKELSHAEVVAHKLTNAMAYTRALAPVNEDKMLEASKHDLEQPTGF